MHMKLIEGNAVVGQSGGPTAVINESLVGVIQGMRLGLRKAGGVKKILGMRHGVNGLVKKDVVDLTEMPDETLERIAHSPAAALGSSRDKPDKEYCLRIFRACEELDVRYFFYIGGNDSSDTCRIVNELAKEYRYELRCFHVPKTVDNDLPISDHTPGYPSAARYVATAFMCDALDNRSLPGVKINVVMGRNAGFLTAASVLARRGEDDGPHLVYLPEVPFDADRFVDDVDKVYTRLGRCQIAVSEGVCDKDGQPIAASLIKTGQTDAHGNLQLSGSGALGDALAELLKDKLIRYGSSGKPPRVRADTLGYLQRCWHDTSPVDRREARDAGLFAAKMAESGDLDGSVALLRTGEMPYTVAYKRIELSEVAAKTKHFPKEWIKGHNDVGEGFLNYARPLVGPLPIFEKI